MKGLILCLSIIGMALVSCNTSKKAMIEETVEAPTEAATPAPVAPAAAPQAGQRQRGQGGQRGGFGGGQNSEEYTVMVTSLGLNEEQKVQFDAINSSYISKMMKKREEARASESFEGMRDDMRKMRDDQNGAIKNLLTEEQYGIYSAFLEKQRSERGSRRGG